MLDVDEGPSRRVCKSRKRNPVSSDTSACQDSSKRRRSSHVDLTAIGSSHGRERNKVTRTAIKAWMGLKFSKIEHGSMELAALECLKKSPYTCTYNRSNVVSTLMLSFLDGSSSFLQKVSYTPEKVSPEKTSDWFCNSFDSRAARNKSNVTVLSKTSHAKSKSKQMEKKAQPAAVTCTDTHDWDTSDLDTIEASLDAAKENQPSKQNLCATPNKPVLQDSYRISDNCNASLELSSISQAVEEDSVDRSSRKFSCINDSLALIKVRKCQHDDPVPSQSQYFPSQTQPVVPVSSEIEDTSQTQFTVPLPTKFTNYKPSQNQPVHKFVEGDRNQCRDRICTPFNFSEHNVNDPMEENSQMNSLLMSQLTSCTQDENINTDQKTAGEHSASTKISRDRNVRKTSHHFSHENNTHHSRLAKNDEKYNGRKFKSKKQYVDSQQTQGAIPSQPELVSGTQYHLNASVCYDDSQVPDSSTFNQTGMIIDSQDQGSISDCDMFEDSFNDSTVLSQIDELLVATGRQADTATQSSSRKRRRRTLDVGVDPDISSHTQSLVVSLRQNDCSKTKEMAAENRSADGTNDSNVSRVVSVGVKTELQARNTSELAVSDGDRGVSLIHDGAIDIGDRKTDPSATDGFMGEDVVEPVTPVASESLQNRLKKRLKENAGQKTPQGPNSLIQHLREQLLERAQIEAAMVQTIKQSGDGSGLFYGLPSEVKQLFDTHRGIRSLYAWQEECLELPAVSERRNLIYSLPTSGGKTLVAEILILKEILCRRKDALLILPFVSIVQEKVRNLSQFAVDLDFLVEEYAGSKGRFPPIKRRKNNSLFVATIEKAHSIVNSLIENKRLDSLGLIVVDELHMIGEGGSRGATLESTLMKVLHSKENIQIIGMSATLNNIGDLQQFLNAEVYTNDFRPVQLTETIKLSDNIYLVDNKAKCPEDQFLHQRIVCFQYKPEMEKMDPDHLFGLVLEVIPDHSCLVFCPTKKNCENVAMMLCKMMVKYKRELSDVKKKERKSLLKELYNDAAGKICPVLQYTLHFGVAYHHSGLTIDERKLIEEAYSDGTLCLLACTSTLAAGVNLPAKRVILRSPYVGQSFISRSQYKQMIGRAGRAGIDTSGESILICKTTDRAKICELLSGPVESCYSSLIYDGGKGVRNLILSTIGLQVTSTTEDVFKFMTCSLTKLQEIFLDVDIVQMCKDALQRLIDIGLVLQTKSQADENVEHKLEVTQLGRATFKGPIDPDYAELLYKDLKKAGEPLVLSTHLHLLYLVTPYDMVESIAPSWFLYFNQISSLSPTELKVPVLIGVPESYIARKASQQKSKQKVNEFVIKRFYLTLMLYELWKQKTIWEVAEKFQQPRGFIQNLLSSAASFASCVAHFCQEMEEFWAYQDLLGNFVKRLSYCVTAELIPLMEIPGVKMGRAKLLYNAGFQTLSSIANADSEVLVKSVEHLPRKVAKQIVASAKLLLNEKAEAMMDEVEQLVSVPEGIATSTVAMLTTATPALVTPDMSQNSAASQEIVKPV